jgi:O-antigen/teichoic acid export membrane protein
MFRRAINRIANIYLEKIGLRLQVSLSVLSQGIGSLSVLILSIFLARRLTQSDYGTYQQIQLIASTILMLALFGLPQSLYYFIPKVSNANRLVKRTVAMCLFAALVLCSIAVFFGEKLSLLLNNPYISHLSYIYCLLVLSQLPITLFESVFISIGNSQRYYMLSILFSCTGFLAVLAPLFLRSDVWLILLSLALHNLAVSVVYFLIYGATMRDDTSKRSVELPLSTQFVYALPLGLSYVVGIVAKQIDRYIIGSYFSPAEFAIYSRGALDIPLIPIIVYTFGNILMPTYIRLFDSGDVQKMLDLWHRTIIYVSLINFPFFFVFLASSSDIMVFLYSEKYASSAPVFTWYLLLLLIQVTSYGNIARVIDRPKLILYATLLMIPMNISISVVLVHRYKLLGPVLGTILSSFLGAQFMLLSFSKILNIPYTKVFPWRRLAIVLSISLMASPILLLFGNINPFLVRIGAKTISYFFLYSILVFFLGVLPDKEHQYVATRIAIIKNRLLGLGQRR